MSRAGRATIALLLGAACICFRAGAVTATGIALDVAVGQGGKGAGRPVDGLRAPLKVAPLVVPDSPDQWFQPSGANGGTQGLIDFLSTLALRDNQPLYLSSEWGRTTGLPASDHHISQTSSWAADLAVAGINHPTSATEIAAQRISSALGEPGWSGGNLVKTVNGYRFQLLWLVAGHFDHVHVGVRKVG